MMEQTPVVTARSFEMISFSLQFKTILKTLEMGCRSGIGLQAEQKVLSWSLLGSVTRIIFYR